MGVNVNDANFDQEVLQSKLAVLVDFWAPWCGPCKMIAPSIEEIEKKYNGKIKICKINVDDAPQTATQHTVMSIPTLMVFKDGKIMEKKVGALDKEEIERFINPYLDLG